MAREAGFEVIAASPLEIQVNDAPEMERFFEQLREGSVDLIILTSSTGVAALRSIVERRWNMPEFLRTLESCTMVAIGPLTSKAMSTEGIETAVMPDEYSSEGLVETLSAMDIRGKSVFILRSNHGERSLIDGLNKAGAETTEIAVYHLVPREDTPAMLALVDESVEGRVDAFAFTSALSAATFVRAAERRHPEANVVGILNDRLVAAMGGPTKDRLEAMGIRVSVVPEKATYADMLQAIASYEPST